MIIQGQVGPSSSKAANASNPALRQGNQTDATVSELHGRFYESNYQGGLFSIGCQPATTVAPTALSAATILLTASAQPIVGIWNPANSPVNAVILQATLTDVINNVTSVAPGAFVWAASTGNATALSAGLAPFNRKTLSSTG